MSDILIRGMEMPKDNNAISIIIFSNGKVSLAHDRKYAEYAEAVPIPEGHGRLGDLDKIVSFIDYYERPMGRNTSPFKALNTVRDYICNASNTIILAEGETDDVRCL